MNKKERKVIRLVKKLRKLFSGGYHGKALTLWYKRRELQAKLWRAVDDL